MSREILRFGRKGYVSKSGACYGVFISGDGNSIDQQRRLQDGFPFYTANCSTSRANNMITQLDGNDVPNDRNGWVVIYYPGEMQSHLGEYVLQDKFYGKQYWKAYLTGFGWKATLLGNEEQMNDYAGTTNEFLTPEETAELPRQKKPSTDLSFLNDQSTKIKAAAIIAAIVLLVIIWKR